MRKENHQKNLKNPREYQNHLKYSKRNQINKYYQINLINQANQINQIHVADSLIFQEQHYINSKEFHINKKLKNYKHK